MRGVGLVGAGAFGEFCLEAFAEMNEVRIAAVADVDFARAGALAARYNAHAYPNIDGLLADPAVEIVALNTPPYLHASQGLAALNAGKHLFCEKPLALTDADGEKLLEAARKNNVRLTVDYVMRPNPFWGAAAALARSGALGALRHIDLANHAAGLSLSPDHWFWDESKSGGVWIEHGVHFFDAFGWVTGQIGKAICGQSFQREDGAIDRVEGLFQYGDTAVHCYHAFDQSGLTEQTTVQLSFTKGYLTLREWVPTSLELVTRVERDAWQLYLPGTVEYTPLPNGRTLAKAYAPQGKSALYRQSIQAGLRNLAQAGAALVVTGEDGLASLRVATEITRMAQIKGG